MHEWKALTILFTLHEIKGHEEPRVRPTGLFPDFVTWDEIERERKRAIEGDPTVLIGLFRAFRESHDLQLMSNS